MLIVALWATAIVLGPSYRSLHAGDEIYFMYAYPACFDAIAFGCCAAVIAQKFSLRGVAGGAARIAAAALVGVTYFGFTLVAAGTAVLLVGAHGEQVPEWLQCSRILAGLRWFGRYSYELYLFHIIVLGIMRGIWPRGALAYGYKTPAMAAFVAVSALAAWILARFYAEPLNAALRVAFLKMRKAPVCQAE